VTMDDVLAMIARIGKERFADPLVRGGVSQCRRRSSFVLCRGNREWLNRAIPHMSHKIVDLVEAAVGPPSPCHGMRSLARHTGRSKGLGALSKPERRRGRQPRRKCHDQNFASLI
jgi:hypothetical protein